jgi:hypothetical protein
MSSQEEETWKASSMVPSGVSTHVREVVTGAATVLDEPLRLMCDRSWVGGGARRFEQDLAGQRQTLQTAWQRALEAADPSSAASVRTSVYPSASGGSTYTGVDVAGFQELSMRLKEAESTLIGAVDALPRSNEQATAGFPPPTWGRSARSPAGHAPRAMASDGDWT